MNKAVTTKTKKPAQRSASGTAQASNRRTVNAKLKARVQAGPITGKGVATLGRDYIGWREFRDGGGGQLAEIAETGKSSAIGTGSSNLQVRLRSLRRAPKAAKRVLPAHRLQYDWVANNLPQFRVIIGMGFPILLRCRDGSKVVADRHPKFEAAIIDAALASMKAKLYRDLLKALLRSEPALSHTTDSPKPPPRPPLPQDLLDAIEKAEMDPDKVVEMLKVLWFDRGARAELQRLFAPTDKDLDGFRED